MTTHTIEEPIHRLVVSVADGNLRIVASEEEAGSVTLEGKRVEESRDWRIVANGRDRFEYYSQLS